MIFDHADDVHTFVEEWSILGQLTQLEKLVLKQIWLHEDSFIDVLAELSSLTDLAIVDVSPALTGPLIDAIFAQTSIKALKFKTWIPDEPLRIETSEGNVSQLTRLSWIHPTVFPALWSAHQMIHLRCTTDGPVHAEMMALMVKNMPDLQTLAIKNGVEECIFPNRVFLQAKNLTSLKIKGFSLEPNFFEALATLHSLTELRLSCYRSPCDVPLVELFTGVDHLTNLRELTLITQPPHPVLFLDHLSGDRLKRLQVLRLPGFRPTAGQLNSLFHRLPSLRQFFCKSTTICCLPDASLLKFPSSS